MHDVGSGEGNKNGAALKDVAVLVITALAQKGGDMSNIDALKTQLSSAAKQVEQQAREQINKQLQVVNEKLKGTGLENVTKDAGKDISNTLNKALGGADSKAAPKKDRKPSKSKKATLEAAPFFI